MKERFRLLILLGLASVLAVPAHGQTLSLTEILAINGGGLTDYFSSTIAGIGDVNGDGFPDFLAGSPGWSNNLDPRDREDDPRIGRAFLFLGGQNPSTKAALKLTGTTENQNFACEVESLGDINDDGVEDYAIGSNYLYLSYQRVPKVLGKPGFANVYFGGNIDSPDMEQLQPGAGKQKDRFGTSIAGRLDFNGDGYNDLAISAPGRPESPKKDLPCEDDPESTCRYRVFPPERVFVFLGGPNFDAEADFVLAVRDTEFIPEKQVFNPEERWFGETIANLGDINADGYDDLGVNELSSNRVYVFFGGTVPSATPGMTLASEDPSDFFGSSMSRAGDLNNDGNDDFVIGAEGADHNGNDSGAVYVYFGGPGLDDTPDFTLNGEDESDRFGTAACFAGDMNNDGYGDLAISAQSAEGGSRNNPTRWSGKVYVYYGGPVFDTTPDPVVSSWVDYEKFGLTLAEGRDINQDGFNDLLIGAPLRKLGNDGAFRGTLYVFGLPVMTPVFNVSLAATAQDGRVLLEWSTLADEVPFGYRVSRLQEGNLTPVHEGILSGATDSFVDTQVLPGRSYEYWIDVLERTGRIKSFGPALVSVPAGTLLRVGLPYPNPMQSTGLRVEYEGNVQAAGVYNLAGRLVRELDVSGSESGGSLVWGGRQQNGQEAPSGIYFLRAIGHRGQEAVSRQIIKIDN